MTNFNTGVAVPITPIVGEVHKVLLKLYNEPEIIELISNNIYDFFGSQNIEKFVFEDGKMYFEITYRNMVIEPNNMIHIFCNLLVRAYFAPGYRFILGDIYDKLSKLITSNGTFSMELFHIVSQCVTIFPLPSGEDGINVIRINLHN